MYVMTARKGFPDGFGRSLHVCFYADREGVWHAGSHRETGSFAVNIGPHLSLAFVYCARSILFDRHVALLAARKAA